MKDIGGQYGVYNNADCQKFRTTLLNMWGKGKATGRVRLVDFYRLGLDSTEFGLFEKDSYLRAMGALDESNPRPPW